MIVTRVFPGSPLPVDLGETGAREQIVELYRPPREPFVRINLISSVSGSAGGTDGTSETLSNAVDRTILGVIREHGDVVVIGAKSLRAEGYLLPRRVPLAVVTSSGNLAGHGTGPTGAGSAGNLAVPPCLKATSRPGWRSRITLGGATIATPPAPVAASTYCSPSTE